MKCKKKIQYKCKERRKKKRRKEKEEDRIRNRGQEQGLEISQNEILSFERNVKGKEVNLKVSRVVGQKFRFGVGGRAKGQARLGFRGKQGKMRCRCQVFILKFQINALSEHNKKLTQKPNLQNPNFHYKNLRKFPTILAYLSYLKKQGKSGALQTKIGRSLISGRKKFQDARPEKISTKKFPEKISSNSFSRSQLPRKFAISKNL